MRVRDLLLAVMIAVVWGVNFVVIHAGLRHTPPLLFATLRFVAVAVPAIFLVGRPRAPWRWVIITGLLLNVAQFGLLFAGMAAGLPSGLSGLVIQIQPVFTTAFAAIFLGERPGRLRMLGVGISVIGLTVVGSSLGADRPVGAFALVVTAGAAWAAGNIAIRKADAPDMPRFMVWAGAVSVPPLAVLSLLIEGPAADLAALRQFDLATAGAVAYVAWGATLIGYVAWGALIRRHGAGTVAPFSMLVPVFAMGSAALVLREPVTGTDLAGGVLVIAGVLLGAVRRPAPARTSSGASGAASVGAVAVSSPAADAVTADR